MLIALPAYNEATVIADVIGSLRKEGFNRIVVIDDGSSDNTATLCESLGVEVVSLPVNRGVGAAFRTAIAYAKKHNEDQLILMDADGQHYPEDINALNRVQEEQSVDVVIGSRFMHQQLEHIPRIRRVYNKLANWLTYMGERNVTDSQSGFRLLSKKAIQTLHLECDDYAACSEMIWAARRQGLSLAEAPIRVRYTDYSMSKGQNFWKGIKTALSLVRKW